MISSNDGRENSWTNGIPNMNKCRLRKYRMKTMPIEQISDRSQRHPKTRANKELTLETSTLRTLSGGFFTFTNYKLNVRELVQQPRSQGLSSYRPLEMRDPGNEVASSASCT